MVQIMFPRIYIPWVGLYEGEFLNIELLGIGIKVPPMGITLIPYTELTPPFLILDTDWIVNPIKEAIDSVAKKVWDMCGSILDSWSEDFYERRGEEKE